MTYYASVDSLPYPVRKKLPKDAVRVFFDAANNEYEQIIKSAKTYTQDAIDTAVLNAGWAEVKKVWHKSPNEGERWIKKAKEPAAMETTTILKIDEEQRMAYGWASVITENGEAVVDTQGDIIEADELVKATTNFMMDARMAKMMHSGDGIGEVVHSFPLTAELAKALGIDCTKEGWIVGVKVHDDEVWKACKDGKLKAFSIGGTGVREEAV